ncbi:hypothetical protein AWC38_SpisGene18142 [Stylophora pistillata]|uniref:Uncharacterized protein n=1 Tax=Stylophora pistillata TaxID=50429 RepID=A0A2B4RL54_STYPI|nr:hypothetical protein AWC38_SpisGene18142 [Stylophora pistillata]
MRQFRKCDDNDGVKEDADVSAGTVAANDGHDDDNDGNGDGEINDDGDWINVCCKTEEDSNYEHELTLKSKCY